MPEEQPTEQPASAPRAQPSHEEVAQLAYELWEAGGGTAEENWARAEAFLTAAAAYANE